ncbi:uncharacterized protein LOC132263321 [Phlebotomus argentipes]|uniref:uncharacterized protein LOC132263321 n=1 Tax=Phlebotomus argentipes TaxID=94469 RepID=UPI002892CB89|nr:uncharacterized protein LOC132263321 [Phlebotomus argentipes]
MELRQNHSPCLQNDTILRPNAGIKREKVRMLKDVESNRKMIQLVKEFPFLYDRSHKLFFHPQSNKKVWDDIGERLGRSGKECAKTYRVLYIRFGIHHVMLSSVEAQKKGFPRRQFPYYQDMLFLANHIDPIRAQKRARKMLRTVKLEQETEDTPETPPQPKAPQTKKKKATKKSAQTNSVPVPLVFPNTTLSSPLEAMEDEEDSIYCDNYSYVIEQIPSNVKFNPATDQDFAEDICLNDFQGKWQEDIPMEKVLPLEMPRKDPANAEEVDFFFNSVSQQVVRARLTSANFSDLKSSIRNALKFNGNKL